MNTWKDYVSLRIKGEENGVPWFLHDKLKCYEFCSKHNIPTVKVYDVFDNPEDITFKNADCMEFVLKPTLESSTKGVMVLRREDNGFYDSMKRKIFSFKEIVEYQNELFKNNKNKSNKIILEAKVKDRLPINIPRDYKAYGFKGEIALILNIDRNTKPGTSVWYDKNFDFLSEADIKNNPKYVSSRENPVKPENWEEMLFFFKRVSSLVPTPFASIDAYDTSDGFVLGEITLAPGGLYHGLHYQMSDSLNEHMGELWAKAINCS